MKMISECADRGSLLCGGICGIVLITAMLFSCGNESVRHGQQITDREKDSVRFFSYLSYLDSVNYISNEPAPHDLPAKLEGTRDTMLLNSFLNRCYDTLRVYEWFPTDRRLLRDHLFAFDLNGDGRKDVIYQGSTGGENDIFQIFIADETGYRRVFKGFQQLVNAEDDNGMLRAFKLKNEGCCADPQILEYTYRADAAKKVPGFVLESTVGYLRSTESPGKMTMERRFTVIADSARLRCEAYVFDDLHHLWQTAGNLAGRYAKGSLGTALARKGGWVYVLMDAASNVTSWETFREQPVALYGWMQADETDLELRQ